MDVDSEPQARPLTYNVGSRQEIIKQFGLVTYLKGINLKISWRNGSNLIPWAEPY
jgi:hypothetical protein